MAFVDELYARYGTQNVIRLSQIDDTDTASVDTTVIDAVETDVGGIFKLYGGVEYDSTDTRMLALACDVGIFLLRRRSGEHDMLTEQWRDILERLKQLRRVTHSNTITTTKVLVNSIGDDRKNKSAFDEATLYHQGFPGARQTAPDYFFGYFN